ncbi:MAG: response regulator [Bacteroidales bacterium]|nr:response regulator [Bacteroidales bacterium]
MPKTYAQNSAVKRCALTILPKFEIRRSFLILIVVIGFLSCKSANRKPEGFLTSFVNADTLDLKTFDSRNFSEPDSLPLPVFKRIYPTLITSSAIADRKIQDLKPTIVEAGVPEIIEIQSMKPPVINKAEPLIIRAGIPAHTEAREPMIKFINPYSFSFYTRTQGLNQDDISAIVQDGEGNLWIGTYGAGIVRFDGSYFSHFDQETGLPDNHILSLFIDKEGIIWIGTRLGGLIKFDGRNYTIFNDQNGLRNNSVEAILQDNHGNYWFGSYGGGVSHFDGETFIHYTTEQGLAGNIVYTIEQDDEGNMWFGTRGNGISGFDGQSFRNYSTRQGLASDYIINSVKDHKGRLWFGTDGEGVSIFDGKQFSQISTREGMPDTDILSLSEDSGGNIWLGTRRAGIVKIENGRILNFRESDGLINSFITCFFEDASGKMWFGSYGGGIGQYNGDLYRHYTDDDGLTDSFIRSISQDDEGTIWLASHTNGVFKFDGTQFTNISFQNPLRDNRIRSIIKDSERNIWIGVYGGYLVKYDGSHFYSMEILSDGEKVSITSITEDRQGNIWIGTHGHGIFMLDDHNLINYMEDQGLNDNYVRKVVADNTGDIWIAGRTGGITRFNGQGFIYYNRRNGFPANDIFDLIADQRGWVWAGSNGGGLFLIRDNVVLNFTERQGLPSNFVYSLLDDYSGNLWVGTRMGLSRLLLPGKLSENDLRVFSTHDIYKAGVYFQSFTRIDGFLGIGSNSKAIFQDAQGVIWIGANDILTTFSPQKAANISMIPNVEIINVGLFNENIPWADVFINQDTMMILGNGVEVSKMKFDDITPWYGLPQNLNLKHNNNYIVFSFVGITTRFNDQIRYQFKLEGLDEKWSAFTHRNEAHYGNLSPGKYIFRVRAVNNNGILSEEFQYAFHISRPLWRTTGAYVSYFLILVSFVMIGVVYRRMLLQQKEQRRTEEMLLHQEIEIARKSVEFKQNFLANMSHEIRTPLTGILGMAELLQKTSLSEEQKDYLETLQHSGENLRETINMVLDYSKIEAGKVKLKEESFRLNDLIHDAEKLFFSLTSHKGLDFFAETVPGLPDYIKADKQRVSQVLNNLLSNAVKFTTTGWVKVKISEVEPVHVLENENSVLIKVEVTDTGKGINTRDQKNLFKPFFQAEQDYDRAFEGTGLGLSISKELTTMLGGEIDLVSKPGKGSTFWFTFKAERTYKAPEEKKAIFTKATTAQSVLKILLVEDKKVNQKVVKLLLKGMGHKVDVLENGLQAVDNYVPDNYDLILMDIQMPVMDGITATKMLRKKFGNLPPIIGLSANAFEGDRERYMDKGMDEYLTKPVKENDFSNLLEKLGFVN